MFTLWLVIYQSMENGQQAVSKNNYCSLYLMLFAGVRNATSINNTLSQEGITVSSRIVSEFFSKDAARFQEDKISTKHFP